MIEPSGDIKDLTIPWIFQGLHREKLSGTIVFSSEAAVKTVYFRDGEIIYATSNAEDDELGTCLLRDGKITKQYYDASNEIVQKTGKQFVAVLVEYEFLSPQDLTECAKHQVRQIVLSLFPWRDGRYAYNNGPLPLSDIIPFPINTGDLIIDGIRGLDWQSVQKSLPSLKTVLLPANDPSLVLQGVRLEQDYYTVLSLIDGTRSIEEICAQSGIGDFNTLKAVYMLLALTMATAGAVKSDEEMKTVRTAMESAAAKEQVPEEHAADAETQTEQVPITAEMVEQAYTALKHQDNYQVLGIAPTATAPEIKKAYVRLVKVYHPDRHLGPEMIVMKEKFEALFTALHGAYQTLSDPAKRREYDEIRKKRQEGPPAGEHRADSENYADPVNRAEAYFKAGMRDFSAGNFWGAEESFSWAMRLDPGKPDFSFYYGCALARMPRRNRDAEEYFLKAIELDPLKPEYHLELGALYKKGGLIAKALAVYDKALQHNPGSEKIKEAIVAAGGTVPGSGTAKAGPFSKNSQRQAK